MKVSVLMKTYNHERFIAQAVESALMQETDFPYEIVIGEDCSTDGTRKIVLDYQKKYPDRIVLLLHEKNVGMRKNYIRLLQACSGEYIAELEGDDFWTSPHKLQKQVDFLDAHPDFVICFHPVRIFRDGADGEGEIFPQGVKEVSELEDLFEYNFIPTCSVMYRSGRIGEFPPWYHELKMGDWTVHLLNARHGRIRRLDDVMGGYRVHAGGAWSGLDPISRLKENVRAYRMFDEYFRGRYGRVIRRRLLDHYLELADLLEEAGDSESAKEYRNRSLAAAFSSGNGRRIAVCKKWLRARFPRLRAVFGK